MPIVLPDLDDGGVSRRSIPLRLRSRSVCDMRLKGRLIAALTLMVGVLALACSNNPYPGADDHEKVLYLPFSAPPKTLDPQVAYSTADHAITGKVYDTLLEYHYLERPYRLIPSMAQQVPQAEHLEGGQVRYTLHLRDGLSFAEDDCFALADSPAARKARRRPVVASDFVFALRRIADPKVTSPVTDPFSNLVGFREFTTRLTERRKQSAFASLPVREQYASAAGGPKAGAAPEGFVGAAAPDDRTLVLTLAGPYPQILYWLAMNFSSPVPWEAIAYYTGEDERPAFAEHPVGSGAYRVTHYNKQARMVLEKNEHWYGITRPEQRAPGAVFPDVPADLEGDDVEDLRKRSGQPLPFLERIEYRMEKERIPSFSKFIQGYYDVSGIARESFDKIIQEDGLSPEMAAKGMRLSQSVTPAIYYIGFNMDDPVIGRKGGERARLLRQAMSRATDVDEYLRLFLNGRGIPAHSPLPPGLFGYDADYKNPYRDGNLEAARKLLKKAGLPGGIDPKTGRPLHLTFDVPDTSPEGRLRFMLWVNQWRRLGLDVTLDATNYNKFQEKVRDGAYQVFQWGWVADYPDPENFLFLLTTPMARSESGGPNSANFKNAAYDALFAKMRTRESDATRAEIIAQMRDILERERPWIELFHPEEYALVHGWLKNVRPAGLSIPTVKYHDIEPESRARLRREWNRPILWPAFALLLFLIAVIAPGVVTFYRERQ